MLEEMPIVPRMPYVVDSIWVFQEIELKEKTEIIIPQGAKCIKSDTLSSAYAKLHITSVFIPSSVETIESHAFSDCPNLTTVTFGENSQLDSIGDHAFVNTGITSIVIPDSVTKIGLMAFAGCTELESIIIGKGVKFIYEEAFANTAITTIKLPLHICLISPRMFNNTALDTLIIPDHADTSHAFLPACVEIKRYISGTLPLLPPSATKNIPYLVGTSPGISFFLLLCLSKRGILFNGNKEKQIAKVEPTSIDRSQETQREENQKNWCLCCCKSSPSEDTKNLLSNSEIQENIVLQNTQPQAQTLPNKPLEAIKQLPVQIVPEMVLHILSMLLIPTIPPSPKQSFNPTQEHAKYCSSFDDMLRTTISKAETFKPT